MVTIIHGTGMYRSHLRGRALHSVLQRAFYVEVHKRPDPEMPRRLVLLACLALLLSGLTAPLRAQTPIYFSGGDSAINGYDTVAYFTVGRPVEGKAEIAVMWKGAVWRFSSQANRQTFESNPRAYAPQYGGYCAYGVSMGYRDSTEPDAWKITGGKLYLIRTKYVQTIWKLDMGTHIARANVNWPSVLSR